MSAWVVEIARQERTESLKQRVVSRCGASGHVDVCGCMTRSFQFVSEIDRYSDQSSGYDGVRPPGRWFRLAADTPARNSEGYRARVAQASERQSCASLPVAAHYMC